jgi:hypothetical protein
MSTTKLRRVSRFTMAASSALLAAGIAVGVAGPASAADSSTGHHVAVQGSSTVAASWKFHGWFPDPLTCHLSGIASGFPYTCNWIFAGWTLWLLTD